MSRRIEDLNAITTAMAGRALDRLGAAGIPCFVDSTLRVTLQQIALCAQGRESLESVNALRSLAKMRMISELENKDIVTNCDGMIKRSAHQGGDSLDVVPAVNGQPVWPPASDPRWKPIAAAFVAEGFRWGGDWDGDGKTRYDGDLDEAMVDLPHYERRSA